MVVSKDIKNLYPFSSKYFLLQENPPVRIHYIDEGKGDPILCLHGNPTWSFYFRNIVKAFSATNRVVALDHLGCGYSDKPQDFSYNLSTHIAHVEKLILELDLKKITLLLHDWGGAIGMGLTLKKPERIKNVILLNTAAFRSKDIPKRIALLKIKGFSSFLIRRANLFCRAATYMTTVKKLPQEIKKAYLAPYSNFHDRVAIEAFVRDIPLSKSHKTYSLLNKIEKGLKDFKCPVLILWGEKDFCFHKGFLKQWETFFPNAKVHLFKNAGHYVLEDEPLATTKLIRDFLNEHH